LVRTAKENAHRAGIQIDFRVGDFTNFSLPDEQFDYCILSNSMYSSIPAKDLRIKTLLRIKNTLKQDGLVMIHFLFNSTRKKDRLFKLRKLLAKIVKGNTGYLPGDEFLPNVHFLRYFNDENEIAEEAKEAGLTVKEIGNESSQTRYAVLSKSSIN